MDTLVLIGILAAVVIVGELRHRYYMSQILHEDHEGCSHP